MLQKVSFTPNVPVLVALKFKDGKLVEGRFGDQVYYTFDQDRCAYLDPDVAAKINQLDPKPGQPFEICKYWSGKKGDKPQWDVRWPGNVAPAVPAAPAPVAPAASGAWDDADDRKLQDQLKASLDQARNGKSPSRTATVNPPAPVHPSSAPQPATSANGRNAAAEAAPASGLAPIPLKIPMDLAFNEILTWMKTELEAHHIQWNDAAQQDFASTALIGGMREGWISPWRRRAA